VHVVPGISKWFHMMINALSKVKVTASDDQHRKHRTDGCNQSSFKIASELGIPSKTRGLRADVNNQLMTVASFSDFKYLSTRNFVSLTRRRKKFLFAKNRRGSISLATSEGSFTNVVPRTRYEKGT
jgi:hypothetical protein